MEILTPCCKTRHWHPALRVGIPKGVFKCELCEKLFDGEDFIRVEKGVNPTTYYCDNCHKSLEEIRNMDKKLEEILEEFEKEKQKAIILLNGTPKEKLFESFNFIINGFEKFLTEKLQSYAKDYALSLLPEEKEVYSFQNIWIRTGSEGFNQCLKEIKDKI